MLFERLLLVVTAGVAMTLDLRTAKVDNRWILFCTGAGMAFRFLEQGMVALPRCIAGILVPLIFLGGLFAFRMMGAGDIKLLCALGCVMGPKDVVRCLGFSLFLGAGISLALLISNGDIRRRIHYFLAYVSGCLSDGQRRPYRQAGISSPEHFHFTVPVFLSVALYAGGIY